MSVVSALNVLSRRGGNMAARSRKQRSRRAEQACRVAVLFFEYSPWSANGMMTCKKGAD